MYNDEQENYYQRMLANSISSANPSEEAKARARKKSPLYFDDLKEFVMCIEQRVNAVGNTCDIRNKMLLIVTGANQGGKSTFLRSIGIAQVMMQCGLPVAAKSYQSGIFPSFFTHFKILTFKFFYFLKYIRVFNIFY